MLMIRDLSISMLLFNPNYVTIKTAFPNRYYSAAISSEQRATTQRMRSIRACLQSVLIPIENVVRFSCGMKGPPSDQRAPTVSALRLGQKKIPEEKKNSEKKIPEKKNSEKNFPEKNFRKKISPKKIS